MNPTPTFLGRPAGCLGFALILAALFATVARPSPVADLLLRADPALIDSGLIRFLVPRFSLKYNTTVDVQPNDKIDENPPQAEVSLVRTPAPAGAMPAIEGKGDSFAVLAPATGPGQKFAAWLLSETGRRTIAQFTAPDGSTPFAPARAETAPKVDIDFDGNPDRGEALAYTNCGRCHVVGPDNRMQGIGSAPSFAALRSLGNWIDRFRTFYLRNPHPAIIRIRDISQPIDPTSPSPIHAVELSEAEMLDILSYTASVKPADLGAPLQNR